MHSPCRLFFAGALVVGIFLSSGNRSAFGQTEPEDVSIQTVDGLRLMGNWYPGGQGKQSDCVLLIHSYGKNIGKGPWVPLAKALQAEKFSVLMFDMRGHGKSTTNKTIGDPKAFADKEKFPFNRFSGLPVNTPDRIKGIDLTKFRPSYVPFLVNDIAAARRFLDIRNDAGECNSGRIHIIADQDAASLTLLWVATEFLRNGIYPIAPTVLPPKHDAGGDIVSVTLLSPKPSGNPVVASASRRAIADKEIGNGLRDKVSMAFVYNTENDKNTSFASDLYSFWKIKRGAKEDPAIGKFLVEVKGGKFSGIDLMDDKLETLKQVQAFIKGAKKKNMNGHDWVQRNPNTVESPPVPLDKFGVKDQ
jgi:hypothetical protein